MTTNQYHKEAPSNNFLRVLKHDAANKQSKSLSTNI